MKKVIAILLCFVMTVAILPAAAVKVSAEDTVFYGGDGSAENPYIISNYVKNSFGKRLLFFGEAFYLADAEICTYIL